MSLSHDDVERLLKLLDASAFDELQLETDGIKLMLRRGGAVAPAEAAPAAALPTTVPAAAPVAAKAAPAASAAAAGTAGLLEVRAPMLGTFFRSPKPGAAPFVDLGARVEPDTTIGIVEVMKLMNAVPAAVAGEGVEVLARDGALLEFDQPLLRVRPAAGAA